jgi:hypothetical protein
MYYWGERNATSITGTRHEAPNRLAGRGAYAIVNKEPRVPSQQSTHLGYCLSHPAELGRPQKALGINNIFGRGRGKGQERYGLRFASVESI